jgi:rare lipoprotein A
VRASIMSLTNEAAACGISIGLAALLASGAMASVASAAPSPPAQKGLASVYGDHLNGKKTASGESYDSSALTAAHRSLPLGAEIRVTNLANGRSVQVRVNDRGPHVEGRIVDLSARAAAALGMRTGVARVRLEILSQPADLRTDTHPRP